LRAARLSEADFTETGSVADLDIAGRSTTSLTSSVGGRILLPTYRNQGLFDLRAVWNRELSDIDPTSSVRLADSTSAQRFNVRGVPLKRDALTLGASFSGQLKRNLSFYGDSSLEMPGATQTPHTALAGIRYVW